MKEFQPGSERVSPVYEAIVEKGPRLGKHGNQASNLISDFEIPRENSGGERIRDFARNQYL